MASWESHKQAQQALHAQGFQCLEHRWRAADQWELKGGAGREKEVVLEMRWPEVNVSAPGLLDVRQVDGRVTSSRCWAILTPWQGGTQKVEKINKIK